MNISLSWVPERLALINGDKVNYDVGVYVDQVRLADKILAGFKKIGSGHIYSVDGIVVERDQTGASTVFYKAPEGMERATIDKIIDSLFNEIEKTMNKSEQPLCKTIFSLAP